MHPEYIDRELMIMEVSFVNCKQGDTFFFVLIVYFDLESDIVFRCGNLDINTYNSNHKQFTNSEIMLKAENLKFNIGIIGEAGDPLNKAEFHF